MKKGILPVLVVVSLACQLGCGEQPSPILDLTLTSTAFSQGEAIPVLYTCDGGNVSPPLTWGEPPKGTRAFALLMDDPDARGWVHWVLFDLPADARGLPEGAGSEPGGGRPAGSVHGRGNSDLGYYGPCPPEGAGAHRYSFRIYALDAPLGLPQGATEGDVAGAMKGHVLGQGELVGTYSREPEER